MIAME